MTHVATSIGFAPYACDEGEAEAEVTISQKRLGELLHAEVAWLASVPSEPVSLHEILTCLEPHRAAKFIQRDVPKRFALRIRLIESLDGWQDVPELVELHDGLRQWYQALRLVDRGPRTGLGSFTDVVQTIRRQGRNAIGTAAAGIHRLQLLRPEVYRDIGFLDRWLDGFLLSRIGTNMLLDQYLALAQVQDGGKGRATGIVDPQCDAASVCEDATRYAQRLCQIHTGRSPSFVLECYSDGKVGPQPAGCASLSYIPGYLRYIMTELTKNSFRATVKNSVDAEDLKSRVVKILVCCDKHRVAIRVSDKAGGIPFEAMERVWSYLYGAAARIEEFESEDGKDSPPPPSALSGYGVGLPVSRLHAQYLGGKLELTTYPGYGTDAYLLLPRIHSEAVEQLPTDDLTTMGSVSSTGGL